MQETPMIKQYNSFKSQYQDKILLFRMGDFYETFGDDAKLASKLLGITLTTRDKNSDSTPLAGFPHHSLNQYLPKIVEQGYSAVVVDQVEDPKLAKGIVKRAVTKIVTPSTIDVGSKFESTNQYILSLAKDKNRYYYCICDINIGTLVYFETQQSISNIELVISKYNPVEILLDRADISLPATNIPVQFGSGNNSKFESAREKICKYFEVKDITGFGIEDGSLNAVCIANILEYIDDTARNRALHLQFPKKVNLFENMVLDSTTISNLELIPKYSNTPTLYSSLNSCNTPMGKRLLYSWILNPLLSKEKIEGRLRSVDILFNKYSLLEQIISLLDNINDIERIVGKVGFNRVNAREMLALLNSLESISTICALLKDSNVKDNSFPKFNKELLELKDLLEKSIHPSPPITILEGGIIKEGYDKDVDVLREIATNSGAWLENYEKTQREITGISTLKVRYNKVFGYYIEVTRTHQDKVPDSYIRKQTLVGSERYVTEELSSMESKILNANGELANMEYKIFTSIRDQVVRYIPDIIALSQSVAYLDVVASFARSAKLYNYVRPELFDIGENDGQIQIVDGRHPVVERNSAQEYISNDTTLASVKDSIGIITGPNMSGKSTYIRQVALIVLMAQIGSFVPAKSASISIVDRIFTRVGASDDLSKGRSTFMVEMSETANILNNATKYSLIILDEVGRGTSTYDGVSIAWALTEYLAQKVGARTLFATHYHELLKLSELYQGKIVNYNVQVEEDLAHGTVIFLRKIVQGGTDRSYGIHVAKMAGVPNDVITRAREILDGFEQESLFKSGVSLRGEGIPTKPSKRDSVVQMSLFSNEKDHLRERIKEIDIDNTTPMQALEVINQLKKMV